MDEKCQVLKYPESAPNTNTQRNTDPCRDPRPVLIYLLGIFDAVCCLKKDPPSKDLWAAGMVLPPRQLCYSRHKTDFSALSACSPAHCLWCHRAGNAWVSLCCTVPKARGAAVPAWQAQCSKDRRSNTWLRKVMTIHAVADPHGIFPFSCNFSSASIITQNWKQGGKPLVASSRLRCLLLMYIHVIDKNIDTYIHNHGIDSWSFTSCTALRL